MDDRNFFQLNIVIEKNIADSGDNTKRKYLDLPENKDQIREYVITMGPLHPSSYEGYVPRKNLPKMDTCTEFWKLCWMTGSRTIVMLCDISPGFQVKCPRN